MLLIGALGALAAVELDVPYVETPPEVVSAMVRLAEIGPGDVVYDLGCGDGRLLIGALTEGRAKRGVGVDLDPRRVRESQAAAEAAGVAERAVFRVQDVFETDLHEADVVMFYLLSSVNVRLRPRFLEQLQPGARLVSHAFGMGDWRPDESRRLGESEFFLWIVPARVEGAWEFTLSGDREVTWPLQLRQQYQQVTVTAPAGLFPERVELRGRDISLLIASFRQGRRELQLQGQVNGDHMSGSWQDSDGGRGQWTATRLGSSN